jgi:D-alanyl-D-alanine carboxypeptidase
MTDFAALADLVDRIVRRQMEQDGTPGLVLAVTDRDGVILSRHYGYADLAARRPVTSETLFEIGSTGKSFTAVLALQLSEEGLLDLDQPVTTYLPWFEVRSDYEPITVRHLLGHTAGIVTGMDCTPDALSEVWGLRLTETGASPGTYFHYSNVGYKIIGLVLTRVSGKSYGELVRERILEPLQMTRSEPIITHEVRSRIALGHSPAYDDRPPQPHHGLVPAAWIETDTGDGSIAATADDMAAFARFLLHRGEGPDGRLISEAGFRQLIEPAMNVEDDLFYGLGMYMWEDDGHSMIGHDGGMIGYSGGLEADLDTGIGVAILVNGPGAPVSISHRILTAARAVVTGQPLPEVYADNAPETNPFEAYVGTYRCVSEHPRPSIVVRVSDDALVLVPDDAADGVIPLKPYWDDDTFLAIGQAWEIYPVRFERDEAERVIDLIHGPDQYRRTDVDDTPYEPATEGWGAYVGHYRAHNPWATNMRVALRRGKLWLSWPEAPDGFDDENLLVPIDESTFRIGDDPALPERIHFTAIADGQALEAVISGGSYYRFFTP